MNFNRNQIILTGITIFVLVLSGYFFYTGLNLDKHFVGPAPSPATQVLGVNEATTSASQNLYLVTKVVDGDTIEVKKDDKLYKLRFIGIDTPETVDPRRPVGCFGKEASNETKRILTGKYVSLEKDVSETDKYGRILRFVYLPIDSTQKLFVNDYLVRQGFAKAYTYPPDVKFSKQFVEAEKEARENNRGLWGVCK